MDPATLRERFSDPVALELLAPGGPLARVAYVAADATPRVVPVGFVWRNEQLVFWTVPGSAKVEALRQRPAVAVTIDSETQPPHVLLVRGQAIVDEVDGVPDGYIESNRLLRSDEERTTFAAQVRELYDSMVEVQITPTWAKVLDFETTAPEAVMRLAQRHGPNN